MVAEYPLLPALPQVARLRRALEEGESPPWDVFGSGGVTGAGANAVACSKPTCPEWSASIR